jgi:hypothetical protein
MLPRGTPLAFERRRIVVRCTNALGGLILAGLVLAGLTASAHAAEEVDFARDVAPILEARCVGCHREGNEAEADFSMQTAASLGSQELVVAGDPAASRLLEVVQSHDGEPPEMPQNGTPLDPAQVEILERWIESGAAWPEDLRLAGKQAASADDWWAIQRLHYVVPAYDSLTYAAGANPIDAFLAVARGDARLGKSMWADRETLIRRLSLDLTGLLPTRDEIVRFVNDRRPDAYRRLVDRLLATPAYGERWGRHWLDVVRFGESRGFERNEIITTLWPYRDYVIDAFNRDEPFDRFALQQLAGDVLWPEVPQMQFASAYLVAGPYDDVGNQDAKAAAQIRANTLDEIIRTTSEAFLGITLGCARCHDHKFDPLTQRDYYAWYATFAGIRHGPREIAPLAERTAREQQRAPILAQLQSLQARREAITAETPSAEQASAFAAIETEQQSLEAALADYPPLPQWWVGTREPAPGPFGVFIGGDPQRTGETVHPRSISAFDGRTSAYALTDEASEGDRRVALARWLFQADQPLVARVLANRLWQHHFGRGLVDTPSDFGTKGANCSHPQLLDWLADRLVRDQWQLKRLHRLIVTSEAYQQASDFQADAAAIDGESRMLWRFPPRRMSAEELRDAMLQVAGQLDHRLGGPGFRLYEYQQDNVATYIPLAHHGTETYRRAVYHHHARSAPVDLISDFDAPDCALPSPKRASTTTPLQALTLLNHSFTADMARAWADRLERRSGGDHGQIAERAIEEAYGRACRPEECAAARRLIEQFGAAAMCRALLNSSEFAHVR